MNVFEEKQSFRQWWIILAGIFCMGLFSLALVTDGLFAGRIINVSKELIITPLSLIVFIMFLNLNLYTKIDRRGIKALREAFHFLEREFLWKYLQKAGIRASISLQEYGGLGIRGIGKIKAYNVSGNQGIQLVNSNDSFLIGTKKTTEAKSIINTYRL